MTCDVEPRVWGALVQPALPSTMFEDLVPDHAYIRTETTPDYNEYGRRIARYVVDIESADRRIIERRLFLDWERLAAWLNDEYGLAHEYVALPEEV